MTTEYLRCENENAGISVVTSTIRELKIRKRNVVRVKVEAGHVNVAIMRHSHPLPADSHMQYICMVCTATMEDISRNLTIQLVVESCCGALCKMDRRKNSQSE
jgi:hypothetical protein